MLGLDDYGSDTDTDRPVSKAPQPTKQTQRPPKKIVIARPAIRADSPDESEDVDRPLKRRKTGAGASSLLSMLPTPKQTNPVLPTPQRVLGGGAKGSAITLRSTSVTVEDEDSPVLSGQTDVPEQSTATLFRPSSLVKGKKNVSVEEPGINHIAKGPTQMSLPAPNIDFFSLGATKSIPKKSVEKSTPIPFSLPHASSAPTLTTFEPPEPTPADPYPGYYQLPSGAWAAYDGDYYAKFMKKWQEEYNAHVRALEKGIAKGFEGIEDSALSEVDAAKEMERAKKEIQEREERKAITMGAGGGSVAPRMTMTASKLSGIARSRHQLSTLLKEAYENREALEEQIAQGKRNRKESGNKYGRHYVE